MRRLGFWLLLLTLVLVVQSARAGDVNLTWDLSDGAAGYKVYIGTTSGIYGLPVTVPAPPVNIPNLPDCTTHYGTVTAFNIAGESGYAPEIQFFPRPMISSAAPIGETTVVLIEGTGFAPGVTFKLNGNAIPFVHDSCTKLTVNTVDVPGAPDWTHLEVCNGPVCSSHVPVKPGTVSGFGAS